MWHFLRLRMLWFLIGFVAAFLVYLFVKFDANDVLTGMGIGAGVGLVLSVLVLILERKFPDDPKQPIEPVEPQQRQ